MLTEAKSDRLEDLREWLLAERERLLETIAAAELASSADTDTERVGLASHWGDSSDQVFEQARNVGRKVEQSLLLEDVEDALQRMEAGTYGICERCGRRIDGARLQAVPATRYDLECQAIVDSRQPSPSEAQESGDTA